MKNLNVCNQLKTNNLQIIWVVVTEGSHGDNRLVLWGCNFLSIIINK
jgi:hypothetical protein